MTRPNLPPGYSFDLDPCAPRLRRENNTVVATFGPSWPPQEVERAAWEDSHWIDAAIEDVEKKLREWRERK